MCIRDSPLVRQYMEDTKQSAKENGYVQTFFGRRLWLPEINSSNGLKRAGAERAAINGPMQGTAADLIKLSMIKVQGWLNNQPTIGGKIIMQVHDELVFEVPNSEVDLFKNNIPGLMEKVADFDIPLIVEIGSGNNWEQAH